MNIFHVCLSKYICFYLLIHIPTSHVVYVCFFIGVVVLYMCMYFVDEGAECLCDFCVVVFSFSFFLIV